MCLWITLDVRISRCSSPRDRPTVNIDGRVKLGMFAIEKATKQKGSLMHTSDSDYSIDSELQDAVQTLLKVERLDSVESIMISFLECTSISSNDFFITSPAHKPDITMYVFGLGKVENTWKSTQRAQQLADDAVRALNDDDDLRDAARTLASGLIAQLSSEGFVADHGPFACAAALTGYGKARGACQLIQDMLSGDLPSLTRDAAERAEERRAFMDGAARIYEADSTPSDADEARFLEACRDFSVARFRQGVLTVVMPRLLEAIRSELSIASSTLLTRDSMVPETKASLVLRSEDAKSLAAEFLKDAE